jgi:hypothetical protein
MQPHIHWSNTGLEQDPELKLCHLHDPFDREGHCHTTIIIMPLAHQTQCAQVDKLVAHQTRQQRTYITVSKNCPHSGMVYSCL